jgi:hypothetical protein
MTYYYRVRAYNTIGTSGDSNVMIARTMSGSGLAISATFDSSITNNPNSAAIESMINQAIAIYESLFNDPITVSILFRYSTTGPDGTLLGSGTLAQSTFVIYTVPWNTYISALKADATTTNDTSANASLPTNPLSTNIIPASADGRAVALNTPPAMFANGTVGNGGPYDGIVTLNSARPFQFTRPTGASSYDALRSTEHEIDEVLGLGSHLNGGGNDLRPQDLFSWSASGTRNLKSVGSRYFSIDSGNTDIVDFNQNSGGDFGDWLSSSCPQANPYVQNAFGCAGQSSDVTATSPEGVNLDVIGYDLVTPPVQLLSVVSTKVHSSQGTFDIDLPLTGNPGIECRSGGANGDYTLVFTFSNRLTSVGGASVSSGSGSVSSSNIDSNDAHNYIVNLTGVTNAQVITVSLANVTDSAGNFSNTVSTQMGVLLGDVDGNRRVDSTDVFQVRQQSLQTTNSSNFRMDVDESGRIDSTDVFIVRQQTLTSLP